MVNRAFTAPAVVTGFPQVWRAAMPEARVVEDANVLDLAPEAHDLVVHALALHWADDPVGQLIQCRRALCPDGLFLGVVPGGETLAELRAALAQAEAEISDGLSPRVVPMGDIRDLGALMQRAGFALPVADSARITVQYESLFALMTDLRAMGETNAQTGRVRQATRRALFTRAAEVYPGLATGDGISATLDLITLTGWAPAKDQPQPLRPGSATARLADALGTTENPLAREIGSEPN